MTRPDDPLGLLDFAANYLKSRAISRHDEVHTDDLADCFRSWFHLPAFAHLPDLYALCERLGVDVQKLPNVSEELLALNAWNTGDAPTIRIREDLVTARAEHSLGHELREVIENAFTRSGMPYSGIQTNDNRSMNRESDHFASCLLMPAAESRQLMGDLGYDVILFSRQSQRSLSSVIQRAQDLYSTKSRVGPVGGIWLFEAPWQRVQSGNVELDELRLDARAHMNGFSTSKAGGQAAREYKARLKEIDEKISLASSCILPSIEEAQELFVNIDTLWKEATGEERRRLLSPLIERVYVDLDLKLVGAIVPTPAFRALLQCAVRKSRSEAVLASQDDLERLGVWSWWRRGRIHLPVAILRRYQRELRRSGWSA